jgi:hypothetical protein
MMDSRHQSPSDQSDRRHRLGGVQDGLPIHQGPISGDGALLPPPFHGYPTENAHEWHDYFKRYIDYKRLSPQQTLELFKVLLRGPAATSFACLSEDDQRKVEEVEKWFNDTYKFPPRQKYKIGHQLFTRKQAPNESVDEYFAAVQSLASQMDEKPSDEIVKYSLIAGLRPNIAGTVMAFAKDEDEIKSVQQLLSAARCAELMVGNVPDQTTFESLLAEVKRLGDNMAKSTISHVDERPSERRVSFSRSPPRRRQSPEPRATTPDRRYQPTASAVNRGNNDNRSRQQQRQPQRQFQGQFQRNGQSANQTSPRCRNCGFFHTVNEQCFAYNKQCRHCLKFSHFARCCRSKLRGDPPAQASNNQ